MILIRVINVKKKILVITSLSIVSLLITFLIAEAFSLYDIGERPTFTTLTYLVFIFGIMEYVLNSLAYIISKRLKKEKIGIKKIVGIITLFLSLMLALLFVVILNLDWIMYYSNYNSSSFSAFILARSMEFLVPAIILMIISLVLIFSKEKLTSN